MSRSSRVRRAASYAVFATGVVIPPLLAPVLASLPVITGTAQEGQTLSATAGTWSNGPTGFAYQWRRNGVAIAGSTFATRLLVSADVGAVLTVTVTATNAGGSTPATSAATVAIVAASVPVPVNSVAPVITGTGTIGQALATDNGTWSGNPTGYSYQWRRDGVNIDGATAASYTPVSADGGAGITCRVLATNAGGTAGATSNAIAVAAAVTALPQQSGIAARWSSRSIPAQADNSALSGWTDSVGGIAASQATVAAQPKYRTGGLGGKPYVQTSGGQALSTSGANAALDAVKTTACTVFVVYRNPGAASAAGRGFLFGTTGTKLHLLDDGQASGRKAGLYPVAGRIASSATGLLTLGVTTGRPTDAGNGRIFANGSCLGGCGLGTLNAPAATAIHLGGWGENLVFGSVAEIYEVIVWNRVLTAPEMLQAEKWARDDFGVAYPWAGGPYRVFHGDSIGEGAYVQEATKTPPAQVAAANGWPLGTWTNLAHTGWNWATLNTEAATDIDPLLAQLGTTPAHLMVWEYYNHAKNVAAGSVSSIINAATTYLNGRRSAGWSGTNKIVFATSTDCADGTTAYNEATRSAYNSWWDTAANRAGLMDVYVPIHTDPSIGVSTACPNASPFTPYFHTDGLHMIDAGNVVLGGLVAPAMVGL